MGVQDNCGRVYHVLGERRDPCRESHDVRCLEIVGGLVSSRRLERTDRVHVVLYDLDSFCSSSQEPFCSIASSADFFASNLHA